MHLAGRCFGHLIAGLHSWFCSCILSWAIGHADPRADNPPPQSSGQNQISTELTTRFLPSSRLREVLPIQGKYFYLCTATRRKRSLQKILAWTRLLTLGLLGRSIQSTPVRAVGVMAVSAHVGVDLSSIGYCILRCIMQRRG